MNARARRSANGSIAAFLLLTAVLSMPGGASAQSSSGDGRDTVSREGVTLGGRAMYFRPKDAEHGELSGGAQLRFHLNPVLAVEGSADYRQDTFGGSTVDIFPVQASLMIYLLPNSPITPYILGGGGWYYTHVRSPDHTQNRFGPHAGAGLEWFLNHDWSIDASYRYVWSEEINSQDAAHPLGRNFSDNGFMLTAALNYRF